MIQRRAVLLSLSLPVWVVLEACAGGAASDHDTKSVRADEVTVGSTVASASASSRPPSPISSSSPNSSASPRPSAPKTPPVVTGSVVCDEYIAKLRACAHEIEPEVRSGNRPVTEAHIASLLLHFNYARDPQNGPPAVQRTQVESIEASCTSMLAGLPATCAR